MPDKPLNIASALFPLGLLIIAMASIQSGASLAKTLFPVVGAQGTTTLRLVFASLILLIVLRPWRARLTAKSLRTVVVYGIALGSMNLLFYMSLQTVPLGIAVALEFTGPLTVALLSSRKPIDFLWVTLAVIGLLLLIPLGHSSASIDLLGASYALGAGVCWAIYIMFGHKAGADNGVQTAALGVIIAAIFIGPVGMVHAGSALLDITLIPAALGVAILSTALPYSLHVRHTCKPGASLRSVVGIDLSARELVIDTVAGNWRDHHRLHRCDAHLGTGKTSTGSGRLNPA